MDKKIILSEFTLDELADKISERLTSAQNAEQKNQTVKKFLSVTELCAEYNMAKPTVYALTSRREIPFLKKGKRLMFERTKIEMWLEQGTKKTKDDIRDEFEPEN